jgi:hypothetical protein
MHAAAVVVIINGNHQRTYIPPEEERKYANDYHYSNAAISSTALGLINTSSVLFFIV